MKKFRGSSLEIFMNPRDLQIVVGQEQEGVKFAIGIFRGPGHNFKPLLTSEPFAETREEAIVAIKEILESICKDSAEEFSDNNDISFEVLDSKLIAWILGELRQCKAANTYNIPV